MNYIYVSVIFFVIGLIAQYLIEKYYVRKDIIETINLAYALGYQDCLNNKEYKLPIEGQ